MELQRIVHRLNNKRKILLLGIAAIAGGSYGIYRLHKSPSVDKRNYRLLSFLSSFTRITEVASVSIETVSFLSDEMENFVSSGEVPRSLKQLNKIAQCSEFNQTLTGVSSAMAAGIFEGFNAANPKTDVAEKAVDKLLTATGTGFISVLVGSFARNLVLSLFENMQTLQTLESNFRPSEFVDATLNNAKFRGFVAECVEGFVGTAVAVYLDKTVDINVYDEIFSALINSKHEVQMRDFLMGIFNGAAETFIMTFLGILMNGSVPSEDRNVKKIAEIETLVRENKVCISSDSVSFLEQTKTDDLISGVSNPGWIEKVSYSLSVPSNRKLLVEVSSRIILEATRSFFEFLLCKFSEFFTKTLPAAFHDLLLRLLQILSFVSSKSMDLATVCLAMLWHALSGTRILEVVTW
ncbi:hypothetical protein SUGI_0085130 [Cryptomeria japonica]|uniref:protein PHLOEM PROTEIN 2-LIKE A10 n=1 Tax=Cryptomeria japonica TaxID=3369 RepID=UPI002408BC23|nr:protein PHLOEM PROTEIN 2-LIKE A10 [Cryptomeria japonica]GLJ08266.1 hypothetical protein SUGI_0085130 [Cryptomeria japonica]